MYSHKIYPSIPAIFWGFQYRKLWIYGNLTHFWPKTPWVPRFLSSQDLGGLHVRCSLLGLHRGLPSGWSIGLEAQGSSHDDRGGNLSWHDMLFGTMIEWYMKYMLNTWNVAILIYIYAVYTCVYIYNSFHFEHGKPSCIWRVQRTFILAPCIRKAHPWLSAPPTFCDVTCSMNLRFSWLWFHGFSIRASAGTKARVFDS